MRLAACVLLATTIGAASNAAAAEPQALARARALYNAASYDAAIAAATEARRDPAAADAALLVLARAHLERYRTGADAADLAAAREYLRAIIRARLNARDELDLLVGLGQSLYFVDAFGAAAELFESALVQAGGFSPRDRALLLDWWAGALDREAQSRAGDRRTPVFERIAERMEQELRIDPASVVASYWLPAALRGAGDLERAWDIAIASWVRAGLDPATRDTVRADVERLVTQALIPERARQRTAKEQGEARSALSAEWEAIKTQWP